MSVCVRKLRKIESGTKLDRVARVKEKSRNVETKTVKLREKKMNKERKCVEREGENQSKKDLTNCFGLILQK